MVQITTGHASKVNQRRVAFATLVGTTIEFYDFFVFGTAAALVFGPVFFSPAPPAIALILSMATFGVSFVMRPIGGIIAGHLGDRHGRKVVLVWTLTIMGVSTAAIGLLPTYAVAGITAPLLLIFLRLVQGIAVGGEWGGAATMAIENAPEGRRGMWGALPQMGGPLGMVLANAVMLLVSAAAGPAAFLAWGWRIPFLGNIVLILIGFWVRSRIEDRTGDTLATNTAVRKSSPILDVLRNRLGVTLKLIGAQAGINIGFYVFSVVALSYLTANAGVSSTVALTAVLIGASVDVVLQPLYGRLSDSIGRKKLLIGGAIFTAVMIFPYYAMTSSGSPALIVLATVLLLGLGHSPQYAVLAALIAEQYDVSYRYSGSSISNQIGNLVWAAGTPVFAVYLLSLSHGQGWPLALLLIVGCAIAIACTLRLRETNQLTNISQPETTTVH
jgi:MFS family permease